MPHITEPAHFFRILRTMKSELETKAQPEIPLVIVGYDFRFASSALRGKLVTSKEDRKYLLSSIRKMDSTAGLLILETCNRMEWIVSTQMPEWVAEILKAQMLCLIQKTGVTGPNPIPLPKLYLGHEALIHVIKVVSGMESLAVGEAQIAGQFQSALQQAQQEKTSNNIINRLAHTAGRIARYGYEIGVRSNSKLGIHGLVADYVEKYFRSGVQDRTILIAGMGEIGRKTAALLEETFKCRIYRFNRTISQQHQGEWLELKEIRGLLPQADALVVATGAPAPLFMKSELDREGDRKLLVMDIGIPRQVAEPAQNLTHVEYRNIDDLQSCREERGSREDAESFEKIIKKETDQFRQYCRSRDMTSFLSTIHSLRQDFIFHKIPDFFSAELAELDKKSRDVIEKAMKQLVNEYSSNMFDAFHKAMESYWSRNGNGK